MSSFMTGNDSDSSELDAVADGTDGRTQAESTSGSDEAPEADPAEGSNADAGDRVAELEATVEDLSMQLAQLERTVTWMARRQAAETGSGICPFCHKGGALVADRTPTGKTRVRCANCETELD